MFPFPDLTVDVDVSETEEISVIEYNHFKDSDKCFFEENVLTNLESRAREEAGYSPVFRFLDQKAVDEGKPFSEISL